jgi:hypothetical protein
MRLFHIKSIDNINMVTTYYALDIKFLACGNVNLTYEQNCIIFKLIADRIDPFHRHAGIYRFMYFKHILFTN